MENIIKLTEIDIKKANEITLKLANGSKYNNDELIYIVENSNTSLISILKTQKLTVDFCKKYLLDEDETYCIHNLDKYITINQIIKYQKHLTINDLK